MTTSVVTMRLVVTRLIVTSRFHKIIMNFGFCKLNQILLNLTAFFGKLLMKCFQLISSRGSNIYNYFAEPKRSKQ